jgi:hypothetical protein
LELLPLSETRFWSEQFGCELEFQPKPNAGVTLILRQHGTTVTAERMRHPLKADAELQAYAGRYRSDKPPHHVPC